MIIIDSLPCHGLFLKEWLNSRIDFGIALLQIRLTLFTISCLFAFMLTSLFNFGLVCLTFDLFVKLLTCCSTIDLFVYLYFVWYFSKKKFYNKFCCSKLLWLTNVHRTRKVTLLKIYWIVYWNSLYSIEIFERSSDLLQIILS